uniref:Uncharacterized protein n=1 Tax=viral metagenome TaxID=1070528 RepID=A0A6M3L9A3_9ZZZZ
MNIEEYADILNLTLVIRRYHNQSNRWSAAFEDCETKDDATSSILASESGEGQTPAAAVNDYVVKIQGKLLVQHAGSSNLRRDVIVPMTLTGLGKPQPCTP